jgi:uncharacterized protein (DUF1330 family)
MSAYMVFSYTITNPEGYQSYPPATMPTLRVHGAEVLVADYASEPKEGSPGQVTVVLRFESKEAALAWYDSADYQAAKKLRTDNTAGMCALCEGFVMPS